MSYISRTWKPVDFKGTGSGGGFQVNDQSSWYNKLLGNVEERDQQLKRWDLMDSASVDISRALDIVAEDISSDGADDDKIFNIDFPEDYEVTKTTMRTMEKTLRMWMDKTEFDYRFFEYVREAIKYGIIFFRVNKDGSLVKLANRKFKGYNLDKNGKVIQYLYKEDDNQKDFEEIDVEDLLILKVGEGHFGTSVLASVYRVWKQLQLLEDAVVIYRIVRAPERRVFFIDIGMLSAKKAEAYLEKIKSKMQYRQIVKNNGIDTEFNPTSMQEDFFLATSGEGKGSRIETLPGGQGLGELSDLQYFNKKLALGLRIPPSYLDSYGQNPDGGMNNDGRVGTAYIAELRYVGYVKRIQKAMAKSLRAQFEAFAEKNGVELPEELVFTIDPPQSFAVYKNNELFSALINTFASAENLTSFSKQYALEKFMQFDKQEIEENEIRVLHEKGFNDKEIKAMPIEKRMNIVYGDGSLNDKTGDFGGDGFGGDMGGDFGGDTPAPAKEEPVAADTKTSEDTPPPKKKKSK